MPRNDQITRQWHLLRRLEGSNGFTLGQLVEAVPDDYPKNARTVRRDLEALEAVGFPIVTERRNGQTRWRLIEGFRNIPALDDLFSIGLGPHKNYQRYKHTIDLITQAIDKRRTAQIRYFSASRATAMRREVDPYRLWYAGGGLYLIAHCHLRKDVRMFAVERIRSITLTDHPYQMPLGFDVEQYVQDAFLIMRGRRIDVELLFSKKAAGWIKDKLWHSSQETSLQKDGRLRMALKVADTDELVGWILSFGGEVQVVRPEALKRKVRGEAKMIVSSNP